MHNRKILIEYFAQLKAKISNLLHDRSALDKRRIHNWTTMINKKTIAFKCFVQLEGKIYSCLHDQRTHDKMNNSY
jgi:hypothetical protein